MNPSKLAHNKYRLFGPTAPDAKTARVSPPMRWALNAIRKNMKLTNIFYLGFIALACSACSVNPATPYQEYGFRGGYKENEIGENHYELKFYYNAYTTKQQAIDYWYIRASELCGGLEKYNVTKEPKTIFDLTLYVRGTVQCI